MRARARSARAPCPLSDGRICRAVRGLHCPGDDTAGAGAVSRRLHYPTGRQLPPRLSSSCRRSAGSHSRDTPAPCPNRTPCSTTRRLPRLGAAAAGAAAEPETLADARPGMPPPSFVKTSRIAPPSARSRSRQRAAPVRFPRRAAASTRAARSSVGVASGQPSGRSSRERARAPPSPKTRTGRAFLEGEPFELGIGRRPALQPQPGNMKFAAFRNSVRFTPSECRKAAASRTSFSTPNSFM